MVCADEEVLVTGVTDVEEDGEGILQFSVPRTPGGWRVEVLTREGGSIFCLRVKK